MFMKAYTAIIQRGDDIRAVDMMVHPGDESKDDELISESHPGYNLVALVPGQHARWSHVYNIDDKKKALRKDISALCDSQRIDVWNTQDLLEN